MSARRLALLIGALAVLGCLAGPLTPAEARLPRTAVRVPWRYRQGLARTAEGWVFSANNGLFLTDGACTELLARAPAIPPEWRARGYDHIGDIDIVGDVLYAPLEQSDYRRGRQAVLIFSADTLELRGGFEVAQHENSFLSVDPATQIAYSMDRFGGTQLLRYDIRADWRPLEPLALSQRVNKVQGGDVAEGAIWLSTDDDSKGVYRVDLVSGRVDALGSLGRCCSEVQGIDATPRNGDLLRVLVIDFFPLPGVYVLDATSLTERASGAGPTPAAERASVGGPRR